MQCLRPGGRLVYATCTFAPEENEAVLDRILRRFGDALRVVSPEPPPCAHGGGLPAWRGKRFHPDVTRAVRVLPDCPWEGFFVAVLEKRVSTLGSVR